MPIAPRAPCRVSTCPLRAAYRGFCAEHNRQAERRRGSSSARGYGVSTHWPVIRAGFLATHRMCDECEAPATEADHVVTVREGQARGWTWAQIHAESNLRPKCKPHHSRRTARDQSGWG